MSITETRIASSPITSISADLEIVANNVAVIDVLLGSVRTGGLDCPREIVGSKTSSENTNAIVDLSANSSLQFESLAESKSTKRRIPGIWRWKEELEDFPPFLSTLDRSGRPRFTMIKLRRNGRLMIALVKSDRPGIVRSYGRDGGLRLEMVKWKQQCDEEHQEDCTEIDEERQKRDEC